MDAEGDAFLHHFNTEFQQSGLEAIPKGKVSLCKWSRRQQVNIFPSYGRDHDNSILAITALLGSPNKDSHSIFPRFFRHSRTFPRTKRAKATDSRTFYERAFSCFSPFRIQVSTQPLLMLIIIFTDYPRLFHFAFHLPPSLERQCSLLFTAVPRFFGVLVLSLSLPPLYLSRLSCSMFIFQALALLVFLR